MAGKSPEVLILELLSGPDIKFDEIIARDARLQTFMKPKGYLGPDGARQYWRDAEASGWDIKIAARDVRAVGDRALAYGQLSASRGKLQTVDDVIWGCRVEDGLIVELSAFVNSEDAEAWLRE